MDDDLRSGLAGLLQVGDLDEQVDSLVAERGRLDEDLGIPRLRARLERMRGEIGGLEEERRKLQGRVRMQEAECQGLEREAAGLRKKLFDGKVSSPKEVDATEKKAQSLDSRRSGLEDQVLGDMMELDELTGQIETAEGALKATESRLAEARQKAGARAAEIDALVADVRSRREPMWEAVSERLRSEYEFRRSKKGGRAVAGIQDGHCTACRVRISIVVANRVERGEGLFSCENCGRLLCWPAEAGDQ